MTRTNLTVLTVFAVLFSLGTAACAKKPVPAAPARPPVTQAAIPTEADLPNGVYARFDTQMGVILVRLHYKEVPITVGNFVGLAEGTKAWRDGSGTLKRTHFYDGTLFHRVIGDFMIQGGDPTATGAGTPGYRFKDEIDLSLRHEAPGVMSMANAGPATNGSQFFITHTPQPHLDGIHAVFGRVVFGQEVVNAIQQGDRINTVTILRVGKDAKGYDARKAAEARMKQKGWSAADAGYLD
ncbi:MAG: peptidylprolyl isomerase [Deltaproteobacteria bacterium]|nr:peptidylprolyl isomerase [Deltaproteobacteria bacterium]